MQFFQFNGAFQLIMGLKKDRFYFNEKTNFISLMDIIISNYGKNCKIIKSNYNIIQ